MTEKKMSVLFLLGALYFFVALVTLDQKYCVSTYASKETINMLNINVFFYWIPVVMVYIFGYMSSFFIAFYLFLVAWLLFKDGFFLSFERVVAGGCTILLTSMIMNCYALLYSNSPLQGGIFGYICSSLMIKHFLLCYVVLVLLLTACFLVAFRCYWFMLVSTSFKAMYEYLKSTQVLLLLGNIVYLLYNYCSAFIMRIGKTIMYFVTAIASKKFGFFSTSTVFADYKNSVAEIYEYITLVTREQNNSELDCDVKSVFLEQENPSQENEEALSLENTECISSQIGYYESVPASFFDANKNDGLITALKAEVKEKAVKLEQKLKRFGVTGAIVHTCVGPLVTVFEYEPHVDTKLSKIITLEDDLAMVLQAMSVRILAPIPGKSVVGFEVANTQRQAVWFQEIFVSSVYQDGNHRLPLILGIDTAGNKIVADLAAMPHLLIAGSTGSGKSVSLNSMLISLLSKKSFSDVKLILIDPKRLEFMTYADIPHLIFPIVTHPNRAVSVLKWLVHEMDRRYEKMSEIGARDCEGYNKKTNNKEEMFPYIVLVVDEFADLMITVKKDIEALITRLAQMARAAGIHMILATQRPSVDVITGLIKVNFTSRIALRVASKIDSRTILDVNGAERLLAKGDMLFLDGASGQLKRIHGPYISSEEIERVVSHLSKQGKPVYYDLDVALNNNSVLEDKEDKVLYEQILAFIEHTDAISISLLQRKFKIGYNRSARIIERLELNGLIMPAEGSKMRRVVR